MTRMRNLLLSLFFIGVYPLDAGFSESKSLVEPNHENKCCDIPEFDGTWHEKQINREIRKIKVQISNLSLQELISFAQQIYMHTFEDKQKAIASIKCVEDFKLRILKGIIEIILEKNKEMHLIETQIRKLDNKEFVALMLKTLDTRNKFIETKKEFFEKFAQQVQLIEPMEQKIQTGVEIHNFISDGLETADQIITKNDVPSLSDTVFISGSYTQAENEKIELEKLKKELMENKAEQDSKIWQLSERLANIKIEQSQPKCLKNKIDEISNALKVMEEQHEETKQSLIILEKQIEATEKEQDELGQMLRIRLDRHNEKRQKLASNYEKLLLALEEVKKEQEILAEKDTQVKESKKLLQKETFKKGINIFHQKAPHID